MYLYLYQSENMKGPHNSQIREELVAFREKLVRNALKDYCSREKPQLDQEALEYVPIRKEPMGKPYLAGLPTSVGEKTDPVHFSVSHSGDWWGCLMADEPVGFDLEICREKVNYDKISERFFTEEEHDWILSRGQEAFFDVWVRKEAYVKYLGTGLGEGLSSFAVIKNGDLAGMVFSEKGDGKPGFIIPCSVADGVKAAYCCGSGGQILGTIPLNY